MVRSSVTVQHPPRSVGMGATRVGTAGFEYLANLIDIGWFGQKLVDVFRDFVVSVHGFPHPVNRMTGVSGLSCLMAAAT